MIINKIHRFHIVDNSPWPIVVSTYLLILTLRSVLWINYKNLLFTVILLLTLIISASWWRDIDRERAIQGIHTILTTKNIKWGIILFIVSEALLFMSFFFAFFHRRLNPTNEIGIIWPPQGIESFNPIKTPLLNTIILLSSGVTITWSHHRLIINNNLTKQRMLITILLGIYFTLLQAIEYLEATFSISDSVYGSVFFLATGFHGIHVIIGSTFLLVTLLRIKNNISRAHHFGFEAAAWYWHFVDIVWLLLYLNVYWYKFIILNKLNLQFNNPLKEFI